MTTKEAMATARANAGPSTAAAKAPPPLRMTIFAEDDKFFAQG
jgi:hypothetical protein